MKDSLFIDRKSSRLIVLLHGYGANKYDLSGLADLDPTSDWLFPNGVISLEMGGPYYESRAWFPIDMVEFQRAMMKGEHRDLKNNYPPELTESLSYLKNELSLVMSKYEQVILGGFSQGAMCTSHLIFDPDLSFKAAILLSGNLVAQNWLRNVELTIPIFQSHGIQDQILSYNGAVELKSELEKRKAIVDFSSFSGGHEIPQKVLSELGYFLSRLK